MNGSIDSTIPSTSNVLTSTNDETNRKATEAIFVLCDNCHWAATFIDKSRLNLIENGCVMCEESLVSSFPILDNESFTFDITERRGVELNFGARRKKNRT
ncbi:MAG: hypothetical protein WBX01_12440 [Nitrososphaeraceae archaeon]|jgi:hypothetical protein